MNKQEIKQILFNNSYDQCISILNTINDKKIFINQIPTLLKLKTLKKKKGETFISKIANYCFYRNKQNSMYAIYEHNGRNQYRIFRGGSYQIDTLLPFMDCSVPFEDIEPHLKEKHVPICIMKGYSKKIIIERCYSKKRAITMLEMLSFVKEHDKVLNKSLLRYPSVIADMIKDCLE